MLRNRIRPRPGVDHPLALGGMAGATSPTLVAAISAAGGLGILGCPGRSPEEISRLAAEIRSRTDRPFGLNLRQMLPQICHSELPMGLSC